MVWCAIVSLAYHSIVLGHLWRAAIGAMCKHNVVHGEFAQVARPLDSDFPLSSCRVLNSPPNVARGPDIQLEGLCVRLEPVRKL